MRVLKRIPRGWWVFLAGSILLSSGLAAWIILTYPLTANVAMAGAGFIDLPSCCIP